MSDITKILREFNIPTLVASENGPTMAEIVMVEEIARLRAENDHLRRVGMGRPSAELHEAALAELRAENERLRAEITRLASTDMAVAMVEMSLRNDNERLRARVEVLERVRAATIERSVSGCRASIYELECALKEAEQ